MKLGKWAVISPPLFYLFLFFLIPFLFAFKISLADKKPTLRATKQLVTAGGD